MSGDQAARKIADSLSAEVQTIPQAYAKLLRGLLVLKTDPRAAVQVIGVVLDHVRSPRTRAIRMIIISWQLALVPPHDPHVHADSMPHASASRN